MSNIFLVKLQDILLLLSLKPLLTLDLTGLLEWYPGPGNIYWDDKDCIQFFSKHYLAPTSRGFIPALCKPPKTRRSKAWPLPSRGAQLYDGRAGANQPCVLILTLLLTKV